MYKCFDMIIKTLHTPRKSLSLIKDSLDQGLFDVMLRITAGEMKDLYTIGVQGYDNPLILIERFYPSLCSIPSIALCALNAFARAINFTHITLSNTGDCILYEAWAKFSFLLIERLLFRSLHAQRRKRLKCDNVSSLNYTLLDLLKQSYSQPGCYTVGDKGIFQKCASCKKAIYCSPLCQNIAWRRHGHKKLCKTHKFRSS